MPKPTKESSQWLGTKNKKPFNKRTIGKTKQIKVTTVPAQTNLMKLNQYSMCLASNIFMWIKIIFVFSFGFWTVVALCVDCCSFGPVFCVVDVCTVYCVHSNTRRSTYDEEHRLCFYWHRFFRFDPCVQSNAICNKKKLAPNP